MNKYKTKANNMLTIQTNSQRKNSDPLLFTPKSPIGFNQEKIGPFLLGKTLGKGTFGKVKLGIHSQTGEKVAIKILEKVKILNEKDKTRLDREIKILKSTFHQNIIKIYSVIETQTCIYLIMEYAEGGELFNYIVIKGKLSESEACIYFHQIIDAVEYMHKIGICHRDLKPENMLLDFNKNLKIIDFGLSNLYTKDEMLKSACGSPGYAAPEMIRGEKYNGLLTDIWSCGIILFVLLNGFLPFDDLNEQILYDKILSGKFIIPKGNSPIAKDLIRKILVTDPCKRIGIKEIREHPWYNICTIGKVEGLFTSIQKIPIDVFVLESMKQYGYDKEEIKKLLIENKHNNITTLYYLIVKKNMRMGISSISDLRSNQFLSYIAKGKETPIYLKLMRTDSTILTQKSQGDIRKKRKNKSQDMAYKENCMTEVNESNAKSLKDYKDEIISEQEEYIDSNNSKIVRRVELFKKIAKKCPIKYKRDDDSLLMINQLKSQYNQYIKKTAVRKKNNFNRGFLQTSASFHKNDKKHKSNTFTNDDYKKDNSTNTKDYSHSPNNNRSQFSSVPKAKKGNFSLYPTPISTINQWSFKNIKPFKKQKRFAFLQIKENNNNKIKRERKNHLRIVNDFKIILHHNSLKKLNFPYKFQSLHSHKKTSNSVAQSSHKKPNALNRNIFSNIKPPNRKILQKFLIKPKCKQSEYHSKSLNNKSSDNKSISQQKRIKANNKQNQTAVHNKKYANLIRNIKNKKNCGIIGKPPNINLKLLKINNDMNSNNKKDTYCFRKTTSNNYSHSNCSTIIGREMELPIYEGEYDENNLLDKNANKLKDEILLFFRKNKITIITSNQANNSPFKFICQKGFVKFAIELFRIKNKHGTLIHTYQIKGEPQDFIAIKKLFFSHLNF